MTVDVNDILLKAAEDVSSGMHCKGAYFESHEDFSLKEVFATELEQLLASKRCALGSIALATLLLGGTVGDYYKAASLATDESLNRYDEELVDLNDYVLVDDPFEAGQQLAELFRQAADA